MRRGGGGERDLLWLDGGDAVLGVAVVGASALSSRLGDGGFGVHGGQGVLGGVGEGVHFVVLELSVVRMAGVGDIFLGCEVG